MRRTNERDWFRVSHALQAIEPLLVCQVHRPIPGPLPAMFPNDPKPARLRGIDFTELASEPHQCERGEMPQTFVLVHVSHGCNFVASKLIGMALWA